MEEAAKQLAVKDAEIQRLKEFGEEVLEILHDVLREHESHSIVINHDICDNRLCAMLRRQLENEDVGWEEMQDVFCERRENSLKKRQKPNDPQP